ncbi:putative beta-glucosidase L [Colletotrichum spinosum]|uniref:beta-glucosidase n=1 Tax=Colletotrichum spinosum TaxID=1347390 RepID=A0A4R8PT08_9PEZI|nr:putative beta-glucosidase L [Colletotrichum spinosum]
MVSEARNSSRRFLRASTSAPHGTATCLYLYGEALGAECRGKGINIGLGPVGGSLGRIARGGRTSGGISADPYISAIGVGAITKSMQGAAAIACPKHWLLNEQEYLAQLYVGIPTKARP